MADVRHPIDALAEEFLDRLRKGQQPTIEEYACQHPQWADEIRDLFPALEVLERGKPSDDFDEVPPFDIDGLTPQVLGDYRIIREIGRGGMGIVCEAEQVSLGRHVALKILPPHVAKATQALLRFRREARSAARLHHTNIVPVFEIGHHQGLHFYAMQFIHGQGLDEVITELSRVRRRAATCDLAYTLSAASPSLATELADQLHSRPFELSPSQDRLSPQQDMQPRSDTNGAAPLDDSFGAPEQVQRSNDEHRVLLLNSCYFDNVAGIGVQIADALAYAHAQGILHRDVKPSNLLIDVHGTVWLTDFGLAKDDTSDVTKTGDVVGTLRYMAPERFRGHADARSDVYSLGLTLYEMLTLRPPQHGMSPRETAQSTTPPLEPPRAVDPTIPQDLETIVLKATAADRAHRYSSAAELAEDLRCYRSRLPIKARRINWLGKTWLWCRRNPSLAGMATAATLLLILACLGWTASHLLRTQRDRAIIAEQAARQAEHSAQHAERMARAQQHLAKATSFRINGVPGSRQRALDELRQALQLDPAGSLRDDIRDEAVAALAMTDVQFETIRWDDLIPATRKRRYLSPDTTSLGRVLTYAFDFSFQQMAVFDPEQNQVFIFDRLARKVTHRFANGTLQKDPTVNMLRFSASGSLLIAGSFAKTGKLAVWSLSTEQVLYETVGIVRFDISPDGQLLAIARAHGALELVELRGPRAGPRTELAAVPEHLSFSPNGRQLGVCFGSRAPVVSILDGATLKPESQLQLDVANVQHIAWHPHGNDLVLARGNAGRAEVWNVATGRLLSRTATGPSWVSWCNVDPLGELLVTSAWDGTTRLWGIHSGRLILTLDRGIPFSHWSPQGTILGSRQTDVGVELIHVNRGRSFGILQGPFHESERARLATFRSDGKIVAASLQNGNSVARRVVLWDPCTRRQLGDLEANQVTALWFSQPQLAVIHRGGLTHLPAHPPDTPSPDAAYANDEIIFGPPSNEPRFQAAVAAATNGDICAIIRTEQLIVANTKFSLNDQSTRTFPEPAAADDPIASIQLPAGHDSVSISPDGRWAATGGWHSQVTCIWNVTEGCLAKELRLGSQTGFYFSPAAPQLVTCRWDAYRFWDLATMDNVLTLPRFDCPQPDVIAVAPSGRWAVVCLRPDALDLVRLPAGNTELRLHGLRLGRPTALAFSPDETQIVVASADQPVLGIWDLGVLTQELSDLGLTEAAGEGPAGVTARRAVTGVQFKGIEELAQAAFIGGMDVAQAREELRVAEQALAALPDSASAANILAWNLVTAPPELRDPRRAIELAEQALRKEPASTTYRNTLGVAHYRAGNYQRSCELLESNVSLAPGGQLPYDLYFLAMSHAAGGNQRESEFYLHMADRWLSVTQDDQSLNDDPIRPELQALRAEAAAVVRAGLRQP